MNFQKHSLKLRAAKLIKNEDYDEGIYTEGKADGLNDAIEFLESIMEKSNDVTPKFKVGDMVEIIEGPFKGELARICKVRTSFCDVVLSNSKIWDVDIKHIKMVESTSTHTITLPAHIDLTTLNTIDSDSGRIMCMHCFERENPLPSRQTKEHKDIIVTFVELHKGCTGKYCLIPKDTTAIIGDKSFKYRSSKYKYDTFSFDQLIDVIRMEVNNPDSWAVISVRGRFACNKFISLYHNGMTEQEILDYKYF